MRGFLIAAAAAALVSAPPAHAGLNFDFSFNSTTNDPGTVTGEIFGLTDNATSAATDLVIDSYPAGFSAPAVPWDVFSSPSVSPDNSFTVSGGQITAADSRIEFLGEFGLNILGGLNFLEVGAAEWLNKGGFAGVTYTADPPATNTPEPTSIALLLSGLFGLRLIGRRRA